MHERFMANIGAKIKEFQRKMKQVDKAVKKAAMGATVQVGADTSEATRKMTKLQAVKQALNKKVVIPIEARVQKAQNALNRVANTLQSIQTVTANFGAGSLLAISPGIVPVLAAAAGGLGAIVSYLGMAGLAAVAFGGVAIPIIAKLFDESTKLTSAQKAAKAELSKLQTTWKGITKDLEKPVLQAFSQSMQVANKMLKMARPLFDGAAQAVNNLLSSMNKSLDSSPVKEFFNYMNKQGGPMLETFGKTIGNFMQGIMSMMVAFDPLTQSFSQGFLKMSESFATWAAGLSKSEKFQSFISYVQTNGPKVLSLIGQLTTFLINLGAGMAPLGTKIIEMVTGFLSWSNAMMTANPGIARFIGYGLVIGGVLRALGPLVITTSAFFSGFGKNITGLIGKLTPLLSTFKSNMVIGLKMIGQSIGRLAIQFLAGAARIAAAWFIAMGPVGWVIAIVVGLVALIIANWDTVKKWTLKIWGALPKDIQANLLKIANFVKSYMTKAWNDIKIIFNFIVKTFQNSLRILVAFVRGDFQAVRDIASEQMKLMENTVRDLLNNVVQFFKDINLYDSGKAIIQSAIDGLNAMRGRILSVVENIVGAVRDFWPFSPAKRGPLSDIHRMDFGGPISDSIGKAKSLVMRSMSNLASVARDSFLPERTNFAVETAGFTKLKYDISSELNKDYDSDEKEQYAIIQIGGYEAKGIIKYFSDEQEKERIQKERAMGL